MRHLFTSIILISVSLIIPSFVLCQDDPLKLIELKQKELKEREESLKKEEERLKAIRKDLDEKIDKYSRLLIQIEEQLKEIKKARDERFEQIAKTFEAMPPEEAAARLSEIDEKMATRLITMMKPKKAAAIMAQMESKKVASLTSKILSMEKKFPTR